MSITDEFKFAWPFPKNPNLLNKFLTNFALASAFVFSKLVFAPGVNRINAVNKGTLLDAIKDRTRPLLTVANHRSVCDDPLFWAIFSFREFFSNICNYRYIMAAHDICFKTPLHTWMFSHGRGVPIIRGAGIYQKGVDFCIEKLNENRWVHVFPEGRVTSEPIRIKWGIARMVMECVNPPRILPIWIHRMTDVWPASKPYYPHFGKVLALLILLS
ncbi:unnamed protein product [Dracunculus medinensis]|uniref:Tafazzin family protein n=1 Tax=Dracunculus medinensis TaxID=318479 RepID=A0A0N4UPZ6_DRAME|nr:unnamed protein product [Dracunculus medinensis]